MDPQELGLLLQWLRNNPSTKFGGPTVSDTPNMGTTQSWTFPHSWMPDPNDYTKQQNLLQDMVTNPMWGNNVPKDMNSRISLERLLMDNDLNNILKRKQLDTDLYRMKEQDRFNGIENTWDRIPFMGLGRYM